MNVNKILPFVLLLPFLASCTHKYKIEGTSSVNGLDGKMLYLKTLRDGEWTKLDSAEVVHGSFSMKGKIDSVQMTTLYMDDESVMPVVLESGKIVITISNTDLKAVGTPLNTALYDFIAKKNAMEESIGELERKETRMVMDGADLEEVHEQLLAEGDSLMKAMNQYVKTFISDNYENVLGPNVFIMLCSSLPYPIMTPQIDDIINEINIRKEKNERVLITTLTIRMSEELTNYLKEMGIKVAYLHSEIKTLERLKIIHDLRLGMYDCVVGINLLREGIDIPEVSLICILDADKQGFLRSERSLIQTIGRCARNENGHVIMYADNISEAMEKAIKETARRREIQMKYNEENGITPRTIIKDIKEVVSNEVENKSKKPKMSKKEKESILMTLEEEMKTAAKNLDFERAMELRDILFEMKKS